jgi:hypothetical protein
MKTAPLSKNRAPEDRICPRGLDIEIKMALLRSKPALRWSYEGFFLNEKKEVMRDEAMFEMWSSVSGGQASAAAPDGGGGPQSRKPEGEETVNRISDIGYGISEVAGGGRWKVEGGILRECERERVEEMMIKKALLRSVLRGSQSFEGFSQRGKEVQR